MLVKEVSNEADFQMQLSSNGSKLIVVDFTAKWCMPCKRISPIFETMASKYSNAVFLKVDVNKCEETATTQGVSAMPTFVFYKNKIKLDKIQGANAEALEEKINKYYIPEEDAENEDPGIQGQVDLIGFVLKSECKALNESDDHPFPLCLTAKDGYLESECDDQLILPFSFTQAVKIHSIKVKAPADKGPMTLKLFINQPNPLDFDSANSNQAVQELTLTEKDLEGNPVNLNYVKFQSVYNLYIFVKDNQSDHETTRLDYLQLIGSPILTTNMKDLKPCCGKKKV